MKQPFKRAYSLIIDDVEVVHGGKEAAVSFLVDNTIGGSVSFAEISIYNLSESTKSSLKNGARVELMAGYKGDLGLVFSGYIVNVLSTFDEGMRRPATIYCRSWTNEKDQQRIARAYSKGTPKSDVLNDLADAFALPIDINGELAGSYTRGKSINGTLESIMRSLAKELGFNWWIDASGLVVSVGGSLRSKTLEFDKDNLLMGETVLTEVGCNIGVKLNYRLMPNMIVTIKPASFQVNIQGARLRSLLIKEGDYRVLGVTHEGEFTPDADAVWTSTAECVRV